MVATAFAVLLLQAIILALVLYLVLRRWVGNLLEHYAEKRRNHFEPYVLNLLDDPTSTKPLERHLLPRDKDFIKELLLQQASQLKGEDSRHMTTVFESLGYVNRELSVLSSKKAWWRRLEAAINLGVMHSRNATSALIVAVRDSDEYVRLAAIRALGELNEPRGLEVLLDAMGDGVRWHGSNIAEVVAGLGSSVTPEIIRRLGLASNVKARISYVQLCGLLRIAEALGLILSLLKDPDKRTRIAGTEALGQIGDESAVPDLIATLDDESWEVRAQSAKALGAIGDKQALSGLVRALSDNNWLVRHSSAEALYRLGAEGEEALQEISRSGIPLAGIVASQILAEKTLGV